MDAGDYHSRSFSGALGYGAGCVCGGGGGKKFQIRHFKLRRMGKPSCFPCHA